MGTKQNNINTVNSKSSTHNIYKSRSNQQQECFVPIVMHIVEHQFNRLKKIHLSKKIGIETNKFMLALLISIPL